MDSELIALKIKVEPKLHDALKALSRPYPMSILIRRVLEDYVKDAEAKG